MLNTVLDLIDLTVYITRRFS